MINYGVTTEGYVIKRLPEIKTELEQDFSNEIGQNLNFEEDSIISQIIGIMSSAIANGWETSQSVYNAMYPRSASGISLDNSAEMVGVIRLPATKTIVNAAAKGLEGTAIPTGQLARIDETQNIFISTKSTVISRTQAVRLLFTITTVADNEDYSVLINNAEAKINSGNEATAESIALNLVAEINELKEQFDNAFNASTTEIIGQIIIESENYITTFSAFPDSKQTINETWGSIRFEAKDFGPIAAPTNELIHIQTPVPGWQALNNFVPGETGRGIENDADFRIRRAREIRVVGAATVESIRARLEQEIEGVIAVFVFENITTITDLQGRPPKSFEVIIEGGDKEEIAKKIWEVKPAGIKSYGVNETKIIIDSMGKEHVIQFSRPVPIYIWIRLTLTTTDNFPPNGNNQVINDILISAKENFGIGDDILIEKFYCAIYKTKGITNAIIELATSDEPDGEPGEYTFGNITIEDREIGVFDSQRIIFV